MYINPLVQCVDNYVTYILWLCIDHFVDNVSIDHFMDNVSVVHRSLCG